MCFPLCTTSFENNEKDNDVLRVPCKTADFALEAIVESPIGWFLLAITLGAYAFNYLTRQDPGN